MIRISEALFERFLDCLRRHADTDGQAAELLKEMETLLSRRYDSIANDMTLHELRVEQHRGLGDK